MYTLALLGFADTMSGRRVSDRKRDLWRCIAPTHGDGGLFTGGGQLRGRKSRLIA